MHTEKMYNEAMSACKSAATAYKTTYNKPKVTMAEIAKAELTLKNKLAEYNKLVRSDAYERIITGADPIVTAAKAYSFSGLAKKKVTRESGSERIKDVDIVTDETEPYNLKMLESKAEELGKPSLMANKKWLAQIYIARLYTAAAQCKRLKADMSKFYDAFEMTADMLVYNDDGELVDVCDMTEDEKTEWSDDLSINKLLPMVQSAVDCIVFDSSTRTDKANRYQVRREDVRFLSQFMFWLDDKTGKPHLRTPDKAVNLMFATLSHVVSGVAYDVIWREEKPAK